MTQTAEGTVIPTLDSEAKEDAMTKMQPYSFLRETDTH